MPTFDVSLQESSGAAGRFVLGGGAIIRSVIQNNGPSRIYLRTYAEENRSVSTVTTAETANGDTYLTVANVSGVQQGMVVTSDAVAATFGAQVIVHRVEGNNVYLYGGEGAAQAVGEAVSFAFTHYGSMDMDYPRGIRIEVGDIYTYGGQPGSYPGKGRMLLISDDQSVVTIINEEN